MTKEHKNTSDDGSAASAMHPLVVSLSRRADARGDALKQLSQVLGVSYERFTQWRRGEADIGNAKRTVHLAAARYLGVPPILVYALCGKFEISDFMVPAEVPLKDRVETEIARVMRHKYLGGFAPAELVQASDAIKVFVIFLLHQIDARSETQAHWVAVLQSLADSSCKAPTHKARADVEKSSGETFL